MLTAQTEKPVGLDSRRQLGSALERIGGGLGRLDNDVRRVRRLLSAQEDPVSLDRLLESQSRALRHAHRATDLLNQGDDGPALSHILLLLEEVREGIGDAHQAEDIGAMQAEASDERTAKALTTLDRRVRGIVTQAGQLFELTTNAHQDLSPHQDLSQGVASMIDTSSSDGTERAIRDLGELLASTLGTGGGESPSRGSARRFQAVADQMSASLDALGLPHSGVQLPPDQDEAGVRSRLIDGLNRNFAFREQDGFRTYYRSAPQPVMRDAESDARLLRGASLVNANMLRSEADGVLAILDRLPEMLRFTPRWDREIPEARARVSEALNQLVETARDPMGINVTRGAIQADRLTAAVADVLELGEIMPTPLARDLRDPANEEVTFSALAQDEGRLVDMLRATTSVIRDDEIYAELYGLFVLMEAIRGRVSRSPVGSGRSIAVGQLEELLTASYDSAAALEDDLARLGSSPAEQTVLYFDGKAGRLSLAQYIGWVRATCEPFARVENRTASLTDTELKLLHDELTSLNEFADGLSRPGAFFDAGLPGTRRQIVELKTFLNGAAELVSKMIDRGSGQTKP